LDSSDVTKLVATGYDQIADRYLRQFGHSAVRSCKLNELADLLPARAHVLDLGCGAGAPVAHDLIACGFKLTGVEPRLGKKSTHGATCHMLDSSEPT
jgi:SAM-dependent methyltransferase